jgi:acyl carrier protein
MSNANKSRSEILHKIELIAANVLGSPDLILSEQTRADEVQGWDSLSHVQIIVGVEQEFGIRMNSTEISQLENTGSLVDLVQARNAGYDGHG